LIFRQVLFEFFKVLVYNIKVKAFTNATVGCKKVQSIVDRTNKNNIVFYNKLI